MLMTVRTSVSCISLVCLILLLIYSRTTAHADLFAGSPCKLHNDVYGVCKNARDCKWLIKNIQEGKMTHNDIKRCSFSERNEDIVCCGDAKPNETDVESLESEYIFDQHLNNRSEEPVLQRKVGRVLPTTVTPAIISGSKVSDACSNYSAIATVLIPSNILHGKAVDLSEFPHMAALGYENIDNGYDFDCGGSLIAEQWIVTAAHCVKQNRKPVIVRLGKIFLHNNDDGVDAVDRKIKNIVRHSEYSSVRKKNDIALVEFIGSIDFSDLVRPACIYTDTADMPVSTELTIAGWGSEVSDRTSRAEMLLKTNVSPVPLDLCKGKLEAYDEFLNLSLGQMCALNKQFDESPACQGDSGGPLFIYQSSSGLSTIVGIVSFGSICGSALPGVYTRVAYYVDWIEKIVWP